MSEIKVLLTINLEGKLSHETKTEKIHWERSTSTDATMIVARGVCTVNTRIPSVATKKLKISDESYRYFVSDEIPSSFKKKDYKGNPWTKLSEKARLEFHLKEIAEGKTFSYEILD